MNRFHRYYCASPGWARLVRTTLVPAVLEGTELGPRVLEVGPGPGLTTEVLAGAAPELTAIEIDPALARATRDRVPTARVVQGDATRMPFADGAFATIDPSWSRGEGYPTWGDVTLRISGTSGVLDVDPFAQPLRIFDHETGAPSWSYMGEDMNSLMLADFLRGVAEGEPSGASGLDGLRTLEIVLAAYRSGQDHEPKKVEQTP